MVIGKDDGLFGMMLEVFTFNKMNKKEGGKRNGEVD